MEIPTNLKHKPIITVGDYDKVSGRNVLNMDAKGPSPGLAQWNDHGRVDIPGKVWRHTGKKQLRQSEGSPITRISDLVVLAVQGSLYSQDAYRYEKPCNPENPVVDTIGLQGSRMTVEIDTKNPKIDGDIILYYNILQENGELIGERLHILKHLLDELGY